ncbi:hypothetical protein B0H14DRAFT_685526 [Mycena olivaceomarginata]|nr:hypothetical protein B0H14DRAFT_685526 [Mycena olivaceomarginata]
MEWTEAQFTAFQLRSPNITQLEISFSELTSDDLRAALAHAPSLTHLSVINCPRCIGDGLTFALLYRDGFTPLVPSLRSLVLDFCGNGLSENILAGMIMSRWRATPSLSSPPAVARWTYLRFFGARSSFSQYFMDTIENARRQGLEFHSLLNIHDSAFTDFSTYDSLPFRQFMYCAFGETVSGELHHCRRSPSLRRECQCFVIPSMN